MPLTNIVAYATDKNQRTPNSDNRSQPSITYSCSRLQTPGG